MYENEPDWRADEDVLFEASMKSIEAFTKRYAGVPIAFFAFDCDPDAGQVLICFDTLKHSREFVDSNIKYKQDYQEKGGRDDDWHMAWYYLRGSLLDYCDSLGDFSHQGEEILMFKGWQRFSEADAYERPTQAGEPDYMKSQLARLFWRVLERLVASGVLDGLTQASPFRLGYGFHDNELVTLKLLNLPE